MLPTIDDVVEEGIASAVVLREADILFLPLWFPDNLKSPSSLLTTAEGFHLIKKTSEREWVGGTEPGRRSGRWARRRPYARRPGRRSLWRAPSSCRRGIANWNVVKKNKKSFSSWSKCVREWWERGKGRTHIDRWSSEAVFTETTQGGWEEWLETDWEIGR